MAFMYSQIDGSFWEHQANGWRRIAICYAGNGQGLNNPLWQGVKNTGPVPRGSYRMKLVEKKQLGPIVFDLIPVDESKMLGRSAFMIHWDNKARDFSASEGCIVNDGQHNCIGKMPAVNFFGYLKTCVLNGNSTLEVVETPPLEAPNT